MGTSVSVEVTSILPSAGGKMIFARLSGKPEATPLQEVPHPANGG
jgi:hypothetical protein